MRPVKTIWRLRFFAAGALAVLGLGLPDGERLQAGVHLWEISQVYSNSDGSVQFIELSNDVEYEHFTAEAEVVTYRDNEQGKRSFTMPENLPSAATGGRRLLLATGPVANVEPDFVIPRNFIPIAFENNATVHLTFSIQERSILVYSFIPTDGFRSIDWRGDVLEPVVVTNFAGDTATIEPPPNRWGNAMDLGGNWYWNNTLGYVYQTESHDWAYSLVLGYMYVLGDYNPILWIYRLDSDEWIFASADSPTRTYWFSADEWRRFNAAENQFEPDP